MDSSHPSENRVPALTAWTMEMLRTEDFFPDPPMSSSNLSSLLKDSEDRSVDETVDLIKHDEATVKRVLSWANSAASGAAEPIRDIHTAVMRVGVGSLVQITLVSKFKHYLSIPLASYGVSAEAFWMHAIATAVATESTGNALTFEVPSVCFAAGLLHDIGKMIVDRYIETFQLAPLVEDPENLEHSHADLEMQRFQAQHAQLGGLMAEHWNLAPELTEVITSHHQDSPTENPSVQIVMLANHIAKSIGRGGGSPSAEADRQSLLTRLGVTPEEFEQMRNRTRSKLTNLVNNVN